MRRFVVRLGLFGLLTLSLPPTASHAQLPPGKEHEAMAREVGVWEGEMSMWPAPDAAPMTSRGTETISMLGKLWLVGEYQGEFAGAPFTGRSQMTYDPVKKKYVGTWIDTMAPFLTTMEGDYDVKTHTLTMIMKSTDMMTNQPSESKSITRYENDDVKIFEIHGPHPDGGGKMFKMLEIKYKRKK